MANTKLKGNKNLQKVKGQLPNWNGKRDKGVRSLTNQLEKDKQLNRKMGKGLLQVSQRRRN